jgi:hypothetical protein
MARKLKWIIDFIHKSTTGGLELALGKYFCKNRFGQKIWRIVKLRSTFEIRSKNQWQDIESNEMEQIIKKRFMRQKSMH